MDVYTNWCGPCKLLDKNTFHNADVVDYINEHFYAVKFNGEGNDELSFKGKSFSNPNYDPAKAQRRNSAHQLTRYFGLRAYPSIVFIDENQEMIVSRLLKEIKSRSFGDFETMFSLENKLDNYPIL